MNTVTETDAYPMPRVDELIDRLGRAKFITTLDLIRGYWQVPVAGRSAQNRFYNSIWTISIPGYAVWSLRSSGNISTHDGSPYRRAGKLHSSLLR